MKKIKVLSIIGTRPEIIKMAPLLMEFRKRDEKFESYVVVTGQHKEMSDPYLKLFSIIPDHNLSIMEDNQDLNTIVTKILKKLPKVLEDIKPDIVLVQGDTSSAFAAALTSYHHKIRIGHVEAGLRTGNKHNPFPEEINRHLIGVLADLHFAPTQKAKDNLIQEGVLSDKIFITGNTVIDALKFIVKKDYEFGHETLKKIDFKNKRIICVTTHRRESFGKPLLNTLQALKRITEIFSDVEIILPVHYNPNVRANVYKVLTNVDRIHLIEPLSYLPFAHLLNKSYLILTDSGGIQEEAPSLGKPVLVLRETTERPEGVEAGTAKIVGTDTESIVAATKELIENQASYNKMAKAMNPYGDGKAALRIINILMKTLNSG